MIMMMMSDRVLNDSMHMLMCLQKFVNKMMQKANITCKDAHIPDAQLDS